MLDEYELWKDLAATLHRHGLKIVRHERRVLLPKRWSQRGRRLLIELEAEWP